MRRARSRIAEFLSGRPSFRSSDPAMRCGRGRGRRATEYRSKHPRSQGDCWPCRDTSNKAACRFWLLSIGFAPFRVLRPDWNCAMLLGTRFGALRPCTLGLAPPGQPSICAFSPKTAGSANTPDQLQRKALRIIQSRSAHPRALPLEGGDNQRIGARATSLRRSAP